MPEATNTTNPSTGAVYQVPHPFCWDLASKPSGDPDGAYLDEFMSWRPGVRPEPDYAGGFDDVADGMGYQLLTVVSVHKPGRFPARVFYTRKWRDPRGGEFGKGALRIKVLSAFARLIRGYRHEYRLTTAEELAEHRDEEMAKRTFPRAALAEGAA